MATETSCPHCRQTLTLPDQPRGRLAKCAHCDGIFPLDLTASESGATEATRAGDSIDADDDWQELARTVVRPQELPSTAAGIRPTSDEQATADEQAPPEDAREEGSRDEASFGEASTASSEASSPAPSSESVSPLNESPHEPTSPPAPDLEATAAGSPASERHSVGEDSTPTAPGPSYAQPSAPVEVASPRAAGVPDVPSRNADEWFLRIPEGRTYGPADRSKLDRWFHEGRIDADCWIRRGEHADWAAAETVFPQLASSGGAFAEPGVRRSPQLGETAYQPRPSGNAGAERHPAGDYRYGGQATAAPSHSAPSHPAASHPVRRTAASDSYSPSGFAANPNATGSPFRSSFAQAHRGEIVFLLGLFGMLLGCPVFSGAAWYMGGTDLRAMNLGLMNPAGRGLTTFGYVLGIVVSCFWIVAILVTMLIVSISILTQ